MASAYLMPLIMAVISSTTVAGLVQFFVSRHDNRKSFSKRLDKLERDVLRTQMLLLILMRPEETQEILTLGEHYFKDLHGNWYMTSIFNRWLEEREIAEPEWLQGGDK